jgi:hypothetical protein
MPYGIWLDRHVSDWLARPSRRPDASQSNDPLAHLAIMRKGPPPKKRPLKSSGPTKGVGDRGPSGFSPFSEVRYRNGASSDPFPRIP